MSVWWARTSGYRLGVSVLFLGSTFYLIGFSIPFWFDGNQSFFGLWVFCYGSWYPLICKPPGVVLDDWFIAVQVMECLGMLGLCVAGVYVLVTNCCKTTAYHSRFVEIISGLSGLCGFIGCMIFAGKLSDIKVPRLHERLGWGFGLSLTGSFLGMITSVIICLNNRAPLDPVRAARSHGYSSGAVIHSGAVPAPFVGRPGVGYDAETGYGYDQTSSVTAQYPAGFPHVVSPPPVAGDAPPGQSLP